MIEDLEGRAQLRSTPRKDEACLFLVFRGKVQIQRLQRVQLVVDPDQLLDYAFSVLSLELQAVCTLRFDDSSFKSASDDDVLDIGGGIR